LIVICWDLVRRKRAASLHGESSVSPTQADLRVNEQAPGNPFPHEIADARHEALDKVRREVADYERDLDGRFANDLQLKAKLSAFARENQLDHALVCLWEEVKNYPAWSRRTDLSEWNKLGVSDLAESETDRKRAVSFSWEGGRYTVNHREWRGIEGETNADLSLFEGEVEVFGISSAINYTEWSSDYQCIDITAFRRKGSWAKLLLHAYTVAEVAQQKADLELRYLGAEEIKKKFQE
jgi:hypothetical protein